MSKKSIISEPVAVVKKTRKRKPKNVVVPIVEEPVSIEPVSVEPVSVSTPVEEPKTVVVKKERKPNKWILHCKEVQSKNQGLSYREVLKLAKESYSKSE